MQTAPTFADIPTPAILLDTQRLKSNCARMSARAAAAGVRLRPHMKTAKSARVAAMATAGQFGGITVSTLAELEYFFAAGFTDLTYAVGIVPSKLAPIEALMQRGARIQVVADSVAAVQAIARHDPAHGGMLRVLIEIDCGGHRAGVAPDSGALLDIARAIDGAAGLQLEGVLTHAGHSYHARTDAERRAIALQERDAAVLAAGRLREAGHAVPVVSIGSTPTALTDIALDGITEIRPGVYMFFDLSQARLGVCTTDDIAVSVLATVIGHQSDHLLIDAGALALSKDISANEYDTGIGYGLVCDEQGRPVDGLYVADVHQEHGFVKVAGASLPHDALPVGARVRILPNHACMTVAPYREYLAIAGDTLEHWDKTGGW